ncbi:unnamed protein product [Brassica oleracea]
MGFPNKLGKWIAEKAQKNKIKVLQDVIDKLNKALDCNAESENACLRDAAKELKKSRDFGGRFESSKTNLFFF